MAIGALLTLGKFQELFSDDFADLMGLEQIEQFVCDQVLDFVPRKQSFLTEELRVPDAVVHGLHHLVFTLVVFRQEVLDVDYGLARIWSLVPVALVHPEHKAVNYLHHDGDVSHKLRVVAG